MKAANAFVLVALSFTIAFQTAKGELFFPTLGVAASNDLLIASWPASASNCVLQVSTNPTAADSWNDIPSFPSLAGNQLTVSLPVETPQQFFRLRRPPIPIFQFFIFYDGILEFSTAATMNIRGPVHANGQIYTGSGSPLTFYETVTTASTISSPAIAGGGPNWTYTGNYLGNPARITNTPALRPIGITNLHDMIEIPPQAENPTTPLGSQRFYNKAGVVLLVSNTTATLIVKTPPLDLSPIITTVPSYGTNSPELKTAFPFLSITNRFREQREGNKSNWVTQIDVGLYDIWLRTNFLVAAKFPTGSGFWPNILYVADNRTPSNFVMFSVRLTNGIAIPTNGTSGFTLATRNPLYVWGNYNAPAPASTTTLGAQPTALVCYAITVLSSHWSDSSSFSGYSDGSSAFDAVTTTINAAIVTGNAPSTGVTLSTYSGGVHNLIRLLEDWSGQSLWLNGSLVCLYESTVATNKFQWAGAYHRPPTRQFSFDNNFRNLTKLPPGTPLLGAVNE